MKTRCYNTKDPNYKFYGAKGVRVCESWLHDFSKFLEDMGPRPQGYTLDRIEVTGNYSPENCRWASQTAQQLNKRPRSNRSGFTGVRMNRHNTGWVAVLGVKKERFHLGTFIDPREAYEAYAIRRESLGYD
jgi:hypothetical protein